MLPNSAQIITLLLEPFLIAFQEKFAIQRMKTSRKKPYIRFIICNVRKINRSKRAITIKTREISSFFN